MIFPLIGFRTVWLAQMVTKNYEISVVLNYARKTTHLPYIVVSIPAWYSKLQGFAPGSKLSIQTLRHECKILHSKNKTFDQVEKIWALVTSWKGFYKVTNHS